VLREAIAERVDAAGAATDVGAETEAARGIGGAHECGGDRDGRGGGLDRGGDRRAAADPHTAADAAEHAAEDAAGDLAEAFLNQDVRAAAGCGDPHLHPASGVVLRTERERSTDEAR